MTEMVEQLSEQYTWLGERKSNTTSSNAHHDHHALFTETTLNSFTPVNDTSL